MEKNTSYKRLWCIILMLCIVLLTPILVLSASFDNVITKPDKTFDNKEIIENTLLEKYPPLKIDNWFGLPLIGKTLAEAYISEHTDTCGTSCHSNIQIKLYEDAPLIDDIRFYTIDRDKRTEQRIRSYQFYIKTGVEEYEVNDYEWTCTPTGKININGTAEQTCENKLTGTHIEKKPLWEAYNIGTSVPAGTYEIKLEGQKKPEREVDWQIKTNGVWTTDWAVWGGGAGISNVGLKSWYSFEEASGNILDKVGTNNLTVSGVWAYQQTGRVGYAINSSDLASSLMSINNFNGTRSVSFWYKKTGNPDANGVLYHSGDLVGTLANMPFLLYTGSTQIRLRVNNAEKSEFVTPTDNVWYHYGLIQNVSGTYIFSNGELVLSEVASTDIASQSPISFFGGYGSSTTYNVQGFIDEVGVWNRSISNYEMQQLYNGGVGTSYPFANATVTLNSPANNYISSTNSVDFNCSATVVGGATLTNMSLWTNGTGTWARNQTQTKTGTTNISIFTDTYSNGQSVLWTCSACDSDGFCGFATENRTVLIDTVAPQVTIIKPTTSMNYGKYGANETLNWSITDTNFQSAWYNYNGTNITLNGAINSTQFNLSRTTAQNLTFYANDSVANLNTTFLSWTYKVFAIQESYSTSILEGSSGTFLINITSSSSSVVPYLVFDGTSYLGTAVKDGSNYYISKTIDIPTVTSDSNKTFYWSMLLSDASYVNTTATNITVTNFAIDNCTANSNKIITFLFKDEATNVLMTGETRNIETEIEIFALDGTAISDYNTQWTNSSNVSICINSTLVGEQYKYDMVTTFSVNNYVVEYWYADKEPLNASLIPVTINLMDLLALDSTSFLFNYFDSSGLIVDNIIVHTWRKYVGEGLFREVERSKQNEDGKTIVHLVEEDVIYYFTITLNNVLLYTSETYTALCPSAPCTISLNAGGISAEFGTDWDLVDDGGYSITSDTTTRTVTLNFATSTPSTFNLTVYKLDSEGKYEAVASGQTTALSSSIDVAVPIISGNVTFFASVYQDGDFKKSVWIDYGSKARTYLGNTLSIFIAILIILSLGLLAVSEGSGTIVFVLLGVFLTSILGLVNWNASGVVASILTYLIIAGGLLIWKITRKNR